MRDIDNYIELAKEKQGLRSDRELCRALGFRGQSVSLWRHRKAMPTDENMVELAKLAEMDPETALLELAYWRTCSRNEHAAAQVFLRMATRTGAAILISFGLIGSPSTDLNAAGTSGQVSGSNVYYVK